MPDPSTAPVISPFLNAVIGGITGAIEISITYPTEYTKTVMQLFKEKSKLGALGVIKQTIKQRGFFGLYRGYSALLFFSVPKNYVRFGAYSIIKDNYLTEKSKINTFLCGLAAGAAEAMLVVTIQETLKVQLIHDKFMAEPKYRNLFHGIYSIVSKQTGMLGLYKGKEKLKKNSLFRLGGVETLMKQSSNQGVRFLVYQDTQEFLKKYIGIDFLRNLFAGAFAGFCSVMANNPIDVIKTLRQGKDAHKYPSTKAAISKIWSDSGIFGFYRGVTPRLMRVCLDVALTFAIFNGIKSKIKEIIIKRRQAKESS